MQLIKSFQKQDHASQTGLSILGVGHTIIAIIALMGFTASVIAVFRHTHTLVIDEIRIPVPDARELHGLQILHISDLHISNTATWSLKALDCIHSIEPDIIAVTGDLTTNPQMLDHTAKAISRLRAKLGIFVSLGNHDHWQRSRLQHLLGLTGRFVHPKQIEHKMEEYGIKTLVNGSLLVNGPNGNFYIAGLDDPYLGLNRYDKTYSMIGSDCPVILMAHSPDAIADISSHRCDLMLSGHTHGGQIRMPMVPIRPFTNTQRDLPSPHGLMVLDGISVHVSAGIGTSSELPLRFNCPPRATILKIVDPGVESG